MDDALEVSGNKLFCKKCGHLIASKLKFWNFNKFQNLRVKFLTFMIEN